MGKGYSVRLLTGAIVEVEIEELTAVAIDEYLLFPSLGQVAKQKYGIARCFKFYTKPIGNFLSQRHPSLFGEI